MTTTVPTRAAVATPRPRTLRARDVADLTVASAYPCISVLMPTEPSARMTAADLERLHDLLADVDTELRNRGVTTRGRLMRKLAHAAQEAAGHSSDRGLAMYVNLAVQRTFSLPMPVRARSVVERTFATRVLLTALHRMPPHLLLVLHAASASLYQGADGGLRLIGHRDAFPSGGPVRVAAPSDAGAAAALDDLTDNFLRDVDQMLAGHRAEHPSPLVLGGSPTVIDKFCAVSRNLDRLAGRVAPDDAETAPALARASSVVVGRYLRSRRDDALVRLHEALAARPDDVACGVTACWQAAHQRDPAMLLVEEDFVSPGRPDDLGPRAQGPGQLVVHDLVDDLMEVVIVRGGQLALVGNGDLIAQGRIALVSRRTNAHPGPGPRRNPG